MAYDKANYERNKNNPAQRMRHLKRYDITLEEYTELHDTQDGLCAICHETNGNKMLCVDHDHETGKVRGLLCHSCNIRLGIFESNKSKFETYLNKYKD